MDPDYRQRVEDRAYTVSHCSARKSSEGLYRATWKNVTVMKQQIEQIEA